jgi:hypothetical protein
MPALKQNPSPVQRQGGVDWKFPPVEHLERQIEDLQNQTIALCREAYRPENRGDLKNYERVLSIWQDKLYKLLDLKKEKALAIAGKKRVESEKLTTWLDETIASHQQRVLELEHKLEQENLETGKKLALRMERDGLAEELAWLDQEKLSLQGNFDCQA